MKKTKQKTERRGHMAEGLACLYFRLLGFSIIARRFRPPHKGLGLSEIDVIAKRGNLFIFVEVKFRQTIGEALFSLTPHQQQAISETAAFFLSTLASDNVRVRFDGFFVAPWAKPRHIANAWQAGD